MAPSVSSLGWCCNTPSRSTGGQAPGEVLSSYQLANPDAEQSAFCVFLKTKEPRVRERSTKPAQVMEYPAKVEYVAHEIDAGRFYQRPGRCCSYCDFLPMCLGDERKVQDTLVRVAP